MRIPAFYLILSLRDMLEPYIILPSNFKLWSYVYQSVPVDFALSAMVGFNANVPASVDFYHGNVDADKTFNIDGGMDWTRRTASHEQSKDLRPAAENTFEGICCTCTEGSIVSKVSAAIWPIMWMDYSDEQFV